MRILYITQWFDPEPAFKGAQFARGLADRGHDVEILTGFPNYPGGKLYPAFRVRAYRHDVISGLNVHRVPLYPSHDRSSLGRIANYLSFFLSVLIFGLFRAGRYDAIYVYHPPLTPALAAALFCRWNNKPMVVEIQDLWPDSVAASGMAHPSVTRILTRLCDFVYRRADRVIAQSKGMRDKIESRGVSPEKLSVIFNWATYSQEADVPVPDAIAQSFSGRINIVYGGNIGQAQNLETVIRAAAVAHSTVPAIRLHLIGDGVEREKLQSLVDREGLPDVTRFFPPVPRDAMDRIFDAADILVMHLNSDPLYNITIPSKTQHYLACGKPVIAGISGNTADILRKSGAALVSTPEDVEAMADAMVRMASMDPEERRAMGRAGLNCYQREFAFEQAIDKTLDVIELAAYRHNQNQH